jgi:hypothetical protein
MLCHRSIKIISSKYSKPLSVEIVKNGWQPAECQIPIESPGIALRGYHLEDHIIRREMRWNHIEEHHHTHHETDDP